MTSQRIVSQHIQVGPLRSVVPDLEIDGPVLVVGSARSCAVVRWAELVDEVAIFDGSVAHNPAATVEEARGIAETVQARTVIAVGSAAAIDLGKAVVEARRCGLVAVPTTLGGSEMSRVYGSRHPDGTKRGGGGSALLPGTVCYDPDLLQTIPGEVLAASGINAWAHSIEAMYARRQHWVAHACAQRAGQTLPGLLRRAVGIRDDSLHADLFESACLAGFAMNGCGMGLHHAICHVLGGLTGLGHGALNVAVLPAAVRTNLRIAPAPTRNALDAMSADDVGGVIAEIAGAFGIPATLADLGVREDQLETAVPAVMAAHHLKNNPAEVSETDARQTLRTAFEGAALR